jgi:hypothetical protein
VSADHVVEGHERCSQEDNVEGGEQPNPRRSVTHGVAGEHGFRRADGGHENRDEHGKEQQW